MIKRVLVTITDSHRTSDEDYSLELTTAGTYRQTDGGFSLTYDEVGESLQGCKTQLVFSCDGTIAMHRTGQYSTDMIFERQHRHTNFYSTPYGELMMGIYSNDVSYEPAENGGRLHLEYTVDINSDLASENKLDIIFTFK